MAIISFLLLGGILAALINSSPQWRPQAPPQGSGYQGPPSSHTRPWPQSWNTLPMALPQTRGSMEPKEDQVPRYGSLGDTLVQGKNVEVMPDISSQLNHQAVPAIQSAVPGGWGMTSQHYTSGSHQPFMPNMRVPQQSYIPDMTATQNPHIPDMTAPPNPHIPDMTAPSSLSLQPWSRSYTSLGNSGRCFNQCRNRCSSPMPAQAQGYGYGQGYAQSQAPCSRPPVCSSRCNIKPRCSSRLPSWNNGYTTVCGRPSWQSGGQGLYPGYRYGHGYGQGYGQRYGQGYGQPVYGYGHGYNMHNIQGTTGPPQVQNEIIETELEEKEEGSTIEYDESTTKDY